MVQQPSYWKVLTRRKFLAADGTETESKLKRVLGLYDLTALGVGSTLGAGVYVLAGQIAKNQAGPSVILSFAIAALASLLAGVCYAEFGARVPKAGSAYVYSYVCIGEFAAFVIGWNLILEYVIGTASVCRGISLYLDALINDTLKQTFAEVAPMNVSFLGSYFDFFAFGLVIVFGVALAFGVETSAIANNFCTCLNLCILLFVIVAGSIKADVGNWAVDASTVNATDIGSGGFFPFGFAGTLKGAATCFFGFVGFDCIATTGEEVRNPRRNIPYSILLSLLVIFICYFGVSTVLTLMVPYYLQDPNAPLPYAFEAVGWNFAMWIVSIGGLVGLLASLLGALFPLPRVMYAMAQDGLLFRFLGKISPRFRVPVTGSIFAAMLTALIAGLFDLAQLVSLLSIGTLLAYSVVAISVTILRYMDNSEPNAAKPQLDASEQNLSEHTMLTTPGTRITFKAVVAQLFNCRRVHVPNTLSTRIVGTLITLFCLLSLGIGLLVMQALDAIQANEIWALVLLSVLVALMLLVLMAICLQPREAYTAIFRVPFVPIVPAISIFINIYLMLQLDTMTWIRFGVWMLIGLPIFIACWCLYDIKNPAMRSPERVAFLNALRSGLATPGNGHLEPVVHVETNNNEQKYSLQHAKGAAASNGGHLGTSSLRSLDEIHNLNDIGDDLIEVKHPNGKIFYVEDTKSNTSTVTLNEPEMASAEDSKSLEDEKSVIAMLDDVLKAEDEDTNSTTTPSALQQHTFRRHFSVDSEMYPSVIETTIVATVHSSSDSSEYNLDELPELESEARYNETKIAAKQMLDDLFASDALWQRLELEQLSRNQQQMNEQKKLPRADSIASMISAESIDDPMHSEKFKNKLSQLILQPHAPIKSTTLRDTPQQTASATRRASLRHSKSEADLRLLVEKVLPAESTDNAATENESQIPRPPKFDPVLYKTINAMQGKKQRPKLLDEMQGTAAERSKTLPPASKVSNPVPATVLGGAEATEEVVAEPEVQKELPFKTKLEAILQRGPSHRLQQRPDVVIRRRPASTYQPDTENSKHTSDVALDFIKSENSLNPNNAAEIISNARKSLKPVPVKERPVT